MSTDNVETDATGSMTGSGKLIGKNILVTRPVHQADAICSLIDSEGGQAIRFPVIEITGPLDAECCRSQIQQIENYDIAIFVSPNAVEYALKQFSSLPSSLKLAAVGSATATSLKQHGYAPHYVPERDFNSEALLVELMKSPVMDSKVMIFRGNGGRDRLADELTRAGAYVEYCEVYRRVRPNKQLELPSEGSADEIDLVAVTSGKGVENLFDLTPESQLSKLRNTQFLAGSERVATVVRTLGCRHEPILAENPGDPAMFSAMCDWAGSVEFRR